MLDRNREVKLLAHSLYQIRILLSDHLGSECKSPTEIRFAAHLAYVLHNEALAVIEDGNFDVEAALAKIEAIDKVISTEDGSKFSRLVTTGKT